MTAIREAARSNFRQRRRQPLQRRRRNSGQAYAEADAALYRAKSEGKNRYAFAESDDKDAEGLSPLDNEPSSAVHLRALLENLEAR